jgi:catechol 2,3-dioxygenase-like lactoylglutathione lyase family enzyme
VEPRVSLITLGVRDLDRTRMFYRDGLGWPLSRASNDSVVFFRTGGVVFALYPRHLLAEDAQVAAEGAGFPGFALAHDVASKDAVDRTLEEAAAAGSSLVKAAVDAFWGGYSGYFADPESFLWEVAWNPGFPLGPDGTVQVPE